MNVINAVKSTSKIKRITPAGKSTTYDFTVKDTHRILANGFYTSNCNHPELETFINIKRDLKKVTGANISIRFTDEFMNAVEKDLDFTHRWPVHLSVEEAIVTKTVKARDVWNQFVDSAWASAEPGALFWDTVQRNSPSDCYEGYESISTNPCLTGDSLVETSEGLKTIKELADSKQDFFVSSFDISTNQIVQKSAVAFKTKENATLLHLTTKSGKSIKLTPEHKVFTARGWVEAGELTVEDKILSISKDFDQIESIQFVNNEDVYDLNVEDTHNFFANDLLVHNCGEIVLSPYDSCRLMVVNLVSFVKNPFTPEASFDFNDFYHTVFKAQRLMDDLIDLEIEAVDNILSKIEQDPQPLGVKEIERQLWTKIRKAAIGGRRTGLGITGLGDCLASLNIQYGSEKSVEMTELLYKYLGIGAHASSLKMAEERGAFPVFDFEKERNHQYLNKMIGAVTEMLPEADYLWRTFGRRNIALTTTAPVGSVSLLTQTTSGIEPAFLLSYKRRRKITENDFESKVDFVDDLGDRWQEYTVYHHGFKKWMDITGESDEKLSPYYGGTANDVDWVRGVDIQAVAQRWIDHSISRTSNLPNEATRELVSDVYLRAWKTGCKGFTVYRDGCRSGVLVSTEEKKETAPSKEVPNRTSPKRPKELNCDIHHAKIKDTDGSYRNWLVLVGLLDGNPYEVFCGVRENIEIPRKYKQGVLLKNGKKEGVATYNLMVPVGDDENLVFKDIMNIFDNPTQGAFTRTISLALRHGVPVHYVVEQLQKDKHSDMFSFSKIISRVLKGYIRDGVKASAEKSCPSCGSHDLIYQEGCITCVSCGWSKCS